MSTKTYRWNTQQAAQAYDAAGPVIHPCYREVQDVVIEAIAQTLDDACSEPHLVDLGGGSGRLAARVLSRWPQATVTLVEPSEAFGRLADERLKAFGGRFRRVALRAQEPWSAALHSATAVVSTSALHHLDASEKDTAFRLCRQALRPGGVFVNGDEYRPPSDAMYRELLEAWGEHMGSALAAGSVPPTFGDVLDRWRERNLDRFGEPQESGDDCHETIEEQTARLYGAGFARVRTVWRDRLWAVLIAA